MESRAWGADVGGAAGRGAAVKLIRSYFIIIGESAALHARCAPNQRGRFTAPLRITSDERRRGTKRHKTLTPRGRVQIPLMCYVKRVIRL